MRQRCVWARDAPALSLGAGGFEQFGVEFGGRSAPGATAHFQQQANVVEQAKSPTKGERAHART